jgi:D-lactate dehydrogenase (cytochrome)
MPWNQISAPVHGRAYHTQISRKSVQDTRKQSFERIGIAAAFVVASLATVGLLDLKSRLHQAEAPSTPEDQPIVTTSTCPLSATQPLQFNLSERNLREAYEEFVKLLGEEGVSLERGERTTRSSTEWSPAPREEDIPSMIVYPRNTTDMSKIAKICHRRRIPMIAFSGGTSLEGTLAAQHKEVCIDFNRHMNQVIEVRKVDMDVTVQPAVGYQELNEMLAKQDMFFPPDPGPGAQIGGMIAQGCSGTNAYRYGMMKDWVLGLEVVLADGTII